MKRIVKIGVVACSAAVACCMLAACTVSTSTSSTDSKKDDSQSVGMANPIHEGTLAEVEKATGIGLEAPEGATDVVYASIDGTDDAAAISQTTFTLDGKTYCYRAQTTSELQLTSGDSKSDPLEELEKATEMGQALSGIYDEMGAQATTAVKDREALVSFNEGKSGYILWIDPVPGIMYSLSMDSGATQELLTTTAEKVFVEAQGDS